MKPPTNLAGYDPTADAGDCTWDPKEAQRVLRFFSKHLRHIEGKIAGQPLTPNPWERDFLATLFGWRNPDGSRRYREFFVGIPRKNNKTTLCAGLSLWMLLCDRKAGPQCYLAAADKVQASVLFRPAAAMVRANPTLAQRCQIYLQDKRIVCQENDGFIRTLTGEAKKQHGLGPQFFVIDEIHVQPDRELYDVLRSGVGARAEPLYGSITTAGHDRESICYELWEHARRVRDGDFSDRTFLPVLYEATPEDDWKDPEVWKRVNPNYGLSLTEEHMQEEFQRALSTPSYENTFKNLHLNLWTESPEAWLASEAWNACEKAFPNLEGQSCYAGLDLASTDDLTALVYVFPIDGRYYVMAHNFCPADTVSQSRKKYQSQYRRWRELGLITETPGNATDYEFVKQKILDDSRRYHIQAIAFDGWQAKPVTQRLQEHGLECVEIAQTYQGMHPGMEAVEKAVLEQRLVHDGNDCLRWQISGTVYDEDPQRHRRPTKKKATGKIDAAVALIMAMGLCAVEEENSYDYRGILTV